MLIHHVSGYISCIYYCHRIQWLISEVMSHVFITVTEYNGLFLSLCLMYLLLLQNMMAYF